MSTAGAVVCPKSAKTGPVDLALAFCIRIWEGFMGRQGVLRGFGGGR